MRWTKLKSEIESNFCDSLKNRISINSTRYGNCTCGHAWITLDKKIIANFCTRAYWNKDLEQRKNTNNSEEILEDNKKYNKQFVNYGEMNRQDVYTACWEFLHEISIEEALKSDDLLIRSLAIIDNRVGKRRLKELKTENLHPLSKKLFDERVKIEDIRINH